MSTAGDIISDRDLTPEQDRALGHFRRDQGIEAPEVPPVPDIEDIRRAINADSRSHQMEGSMTTKVVISCPDNSVHDALIHVESRQPDGTWAPTGDPIAVPPRTTAAPLYLTAFTRVVIEEQNSATAEPYTA